MFLTFKLDMDTRTRVNENIHEETAVQNKGCESLRKSDTESEITHKKTAAQRKCSESLRNNDAQIILREFS